MIYLPLVERELRLAARRTSTYRTRFWAASVVIFIAFCMIIGSRRSTSQLGQAMFAVLTVLAFGYCLLAGVLYTADCLSEEKREGTLGFLFLTDLRGYDVVLGKLVASSLDAAYTLLAIFPVLGLPLLLGGVSGSEFWRVELLLLNTLLFSLALGLLSSAVGREERAVMLITLLLILLFAFGLPALWKLATTLRDSRWFDLLILLPSPSYAFKLTGSVSRFGTTEYWLSMGTLSALTITCVGVSSFLLPRLFQEKSQSAVSGRWAERFRRWRFLDPDVWRREVRRQALIEANPFLWVVTRDRMPQIFMGFFIGGAVIFGIWAYPVLERKKTALMGIVMMTLYGLHLLLKFLIAAQACRRINDDKRSGVLELLLSTRLTIHSIFEAQLTALIWLFWLPVLALVVMNFVWMNALGEKEPNSVIFGGAVILVFDFFALSRVGMRVALRGQRFHRAVLETMGRVLLPTWAVLAAFLFVAMNGGMRSSTALTFFFWWFVLSALYDLALVSWAKTGFERDVPMSGPRVRWDWVPLRPGQWRIQRRS